MEEDYHPPYYVAPEDGKGGYTLQRLRSIVKETRGNAQIERLILDDREIGFVAKEGELYVYARRHAPNGKMIKQIRKILRPSAVPKEALKRAKWGILDSMFEKETEECFSLDAEMASGF